MNDLKASLEAVLFAAGEPVSAARLSLVLAVPENEIFAAAEKLAEEYETEGRGIRLLRMENRLQLCSAPDYANLIVKTLEQRKPPMLSAAALEVLSVVAYYQPATRALVEKMRGVDSSYSISLLQERGLIEVCGRLEAPGRPTLYATTDSFLRVMGIHSLQELPPLPEAQGSEGTQQLRKSIEKLQKKDSSEQQSLFTECERKQSEE
ncbi:MAG: SMC-Scp complex subunit ScpB [Oscillospiraceae bacterium]|nr:SMC-Scp complex subunit ScpB [Oscillospiraceae bacterium]